MINLLITSTIKDQVLSSLISVNSIGITANLYEESRDLNLPPDVIESIYDYFEEIGLITLEKTYDSIEIKMKPKAFDLYSHGGFTAEEELLKANLQKLDHELRILSDKLSPSLLETSNKISSIASCIVSALALFKP